MSKKIVFIIGGARSGKSLFAIAEASKVKGKKAYIATAEALDDEMKERIKEHKNQRGKDWDTYEEPWKIVNLINGIKNRYRVILIDCLTLWLSNLIHKSQGVEKYIGEFIDEIESIKHSNHSNVLTLIIVSNEVGMGIVPANKLARRFRDMAGILNQKVAEVADEVYMMVAGVPIRIKHNSRKKRRNL